MPLYHYGNYTRTLSIYYVGFIITVSFCFAHRYRITGSTRVDYYKFILPILLYHAKNFISSRSLIYEIISTNVSLFRKTEDVFRCSSRNRNSFRQLLRPSLIYLFHLHPINFSIYDLDLSAFQRTYEFKTVIDIKTEYISKSTNISI